MVLVLVALDDEPAHTKIGKSLSHCYETAAAGFDVALVLADPHVGPHARVDKVRDDQPAPPIALRLKMHATLATLGQRAQLSPSGVKLTRPHENSCDQVL